ncbi:MAG: translation initiation factor IF-2 N-terminal domain-containing protein, partial [Deltaproteobacteria bacterium]|nr:translation initiation factor IF-2 N-terminal domain-containing protein [Deltaproteobacteria bacterium]
MIGSGFDRRDSGNDGSGATSPGQKKRVYELAKELGLQNKDLLDKIRALGIEVGNHMSNLDGAEVERLRRAIERERQESLVETRLNDTVIRRRSRLPGAGAARSRPVPEGAKSVARAASVEAAPESKRVFAVPEPTPPLVVVEPLPSPSVAVDEAAEPTVPGGESEALSAAPSLPAGETPEAETPTPQAAKPAAPSAPVIKIPQPVVTGSAATGQFIQLPGVPGRDGTVPKIEIKDRDEELRRLGRSGLVSRGPGGRDWRQPGAAPGQRPGGPPRKKVATAGKKVKQTMITTPAEHKRVIRMGETIGVSDLAQKMG